MTGPKRNDDEEIELVPGDPAIPGSQPERLPEDDEEAVELPETDDDEENGDEQKG